MAIIKTKVPNFTGIRASVYFRNGVGSTTDTRLIDWFRTHGYIVETEAEVNKEPEQTAKPIKNKTRTKANG